MPYLRVYDGQKGTQEFDLKKPEVVLGREEGKVDILIDDPAVSRRHAVIKPYGEAHMIEDAGSRTGVLVNGHAMPCSQLAHEVTIQVGPCVMEYRTDDAARTACLETANPMLRALRQRFTLLPAGVKLRFRTLAAKPTDLFRTGDTLDFGEGGVLLPWAAALTEGQCLEVEITSHGGKTRSYMGEILEVLKDRAVPELCIKLHFVGKQKQEAATKKAGEWVDAWPPK